jgi:hypothetical protein
MPPTPGRGRRACFLGHLNNRERDRTTRRAGQGERNGAVGMTTVKR